MSKEIKAIKQALGRFFAGRRESLGWTPNQLRDRTNMSGLQIDKLENGTGSMNADTIFRVMLELGIGLHLTEQNADEALAVTLEGASTPPSFLMCTDGLQLYVLYWQQPAFLVQVVQTIPHTLRFVATYGARPEEIRKHAVMKQLQAFVKRELKAWVERS